MARRQPGRAELIAIGALGGLFVIALVLYLYLRLAQVGQLERRIEAELNLPAGTVRLDDISDAGRLRVTLRDVVLLGDAGDTVAASPAVSLWFDPASMAGDGPLVFTDVVLERPDVRLARSGAGEWNIFQALRIEANGGEMPDDGGRPLLFTNVRFTNGRITLALPAEPVDPESFAARLSLPRRTIGGVPHDVYAFNGVRGRLPRVVIGGDDGWSVRVSQLAATLDEPALQIRDLQGAFAASGETGVRFDVDLLRVGESRFAGVGTIDFTDAGIVYEVDVEASPLRFAELRAIVPGLPDDGAASFRLQTQPVGRGRVDVRLTGLDLETLETSVTGRVGVVIGGGEQALFRDTDLRVSSLDLALLDSLGLVESLPVRGTMEGTLATTGTATLQEGMLTVDLSANLLPTDGSGVPTSRVRAAGGLAFGDPGSGLRLEGMTVSFDPLQVALLRSFAPDMAERLRGVARGSVVLRGPLSQLALSGGSIEYVVGDAPATRVTGLTGTITTDPELRYDLRARAEPLALATLIELFPAIPFRPTNLSGPIRITGTAAGLTLDADVAGAVGALAVQGGLTFGDVLGFDLTGNVRSLNPSSLIRGELPIENAVTGSFAARGNVSDFRFDVDFRQVAGRFALSGRMIGAGEGQSPRFDVSGDVENFRIGALIGQAALFPAPMTGTISVAGGGGRAYVYDVDLRGSGAIFDLRGVFSGGGVPSYTAQGTVRGLDLSRLPLGVRFPRTELNANVDIDATGTTPQTLRGRFVIEASGSRVSGVPLDAGVIRATARDGLLYVDTANLRLGDTRIAAGGVFGLATPSEQPLRFSISSPNLGTVAQAGAGTGLPLDLSGALQATGSISGSFDYPHLIVTGSGRNLEYGAWAAASLTVDADIRRTRASGWMGEAEIAGQTVLLANGQRLERLQLTASGNEQQLGVGLFARRDPTTDVTSSGILEFRNGQPSGVDVRTLSLRVEGTAWELANPALLRWGGTDGVLVQNLLLQRSDGAEGSILVHGMLPPTGAADLELRARSVDLRVLTGLLPDAPDARGTTTIDAVLEGPVSDPSLSIYARVDSLRYEGASADSATIIGEYQGRTFLADLAVWRNGRALLDGEARIPMVIALTDMIPAVELLRDEPLYANIIADSLDLGLFTSAVPQLADGAGVLTATALVGGTLANPELQGEADLRNGAVRIIPAGVTYSRINGALRLAERSVVIDSITAFSDGTAVVRGSVDFVEGVPALDLTTRLESFEVMDVQGGGRVQLTGALFLRGQLPQPVLSGRATITESTFEIPELSQGDPLALEGLDVGQIGPDTLAPAGFLPPMLAGIQVSELEISVGESVWLESNDARIQIAGENLLVTRLGEDLRVWGVLRAERGTYSLRIGPLVRQFEIASGSVQFFGTPDLNPELDITAVNRIRTVEFDGGSRSIDLLVNISGTVQFPQIALSSNTRPPLPESEVLSLLLFGRQSFGLGGAAGALAGDLVSQEILGGLLFAPLQDIFLRTGLIDYVQFSSTGGNLGYTTVAIGTEITENVFLTVECGVGLIFADPNTDTAGCGTRLNVELGNDLTATAAYEPIIRSDRLINVLWPDRTQYQWSAELRKRWEFGRSNAQPAPILPRPDTVRAQDPADQPGGRPQTGEDADTVRASQSDDGPGNDEAPGAPAATSDAGGPGSGARIESSAKDEETLVVD